MRVRLTRHALLLPSVTLVAILRSDPSAAAAAAPFPLPHCATTNTAVGAAAAVTQSTVRLAQQPAAQTRHFESVNLTVNVGTTAGGAIQTEARRGDLVFRKQVQSNGRYTFDIESPRDKVAIAVAETGIQVTRGPTTVTIDPEMGHGQMDQVRRLLADSHAVELLRNLGAALEASEDDTPALVPLLIADSVVGTLTGDVGAPRRTARFLSRRARAQLRPAQTTHAQTCYHQWEQALLWAFMEFEECVFLWDWWFGWCSFRWTMEADSAWFQFLTCSGLGF
jgi:hypothetical protein